MIHQWEVRADGTDSQVPVSDAYLRQLDKDLAKFGKVSRRGWLSKLKNASIIDYFTRK